MNSWKSGLLLCLAGLWACMRLPGQAMPPGLPQLQIDWYKDTAMCGYVFLSTERFVLPVTLPSTGMIFDRRGQLVWYMTASDNLYNFSPQPNGKITYNLNDTWFALGDSMIPSVVPACPGISGDFHDFIGLPMGRQFSLCNEDTIMDLRGIHTYNGQPGDSMATVRYNTVEERDATGLLLRRWRAIDHFSPADVDSLTFSYPWYLELNHTNSMDYNGAQLLLSHRSNHEVTLIHWATGQVLWRLGGPNNDFVYLNDAGFKSQHDARFAGNGRISIFDNRSVGSVTTPRALVYQIDTVHDLATRLYELVQPNSASPTMGSFREQPNGDGLVCWGQSTPETSPNLSYYQSNRQKVCDWYFQDQHMAYRAVCEDLPFAIPRPVVVCNQQNGILVLHLQGSHPSYLWSTGDTTPIIQVQDTGYYQAYVPLGSGFVGSNVFHVTDVNAACPSTPVDDPQLPPGRQPKCIGTFDLLGRPVLSRLPGHVYLERYDDGRSRKVIHY